MDPETQSELASRVADAAGETALVQVPAHADYLPVIRSASAHLATKAGFTLPEVADLRLAVDEACVLLLRHTVRDEPPGGPAAGAGELSCRFILDGSSLRVVLSREARNAASPQSDEFGWSILSALVDGIQWRADGPVVYVEILKDRPPGE